MTDGDRVPPVGAGLLAKAVGPFAVMLDVPASSRASSLPQGILGVHESCVHRRSIVGASLLAKAVCQLTVMLVGRPLREQARSHRGSWVFMSLCSPQIHCGSELARDSGGSAT